MGRTSPEPPLDLQSLEVLLRAQWTGDRFEDSIEWALLAALRTSLRLLRDAPVPLGYSWRTDRDTFVAQIRDGP